MDQLRVVPKPAWLLAGVSCVHVGLRLASALNAVLKLSPCRSCTPFCEVEKEGVCSSVGCLLCVAATGIVCCPRRDCVLARSRLSCNVRHGGSQNLQAWSGVLS
jgi:hypothetical protein